MDKILIIRLSAIGDIVMATPLIGALRARYPHARIAWLVQREYAELLRDLPGLDEVIALPREAWRRQWRERRFGALAHDLRAFARALRGRRFDLVLDLQGLMKSGLPAWLTRAPRRIGLGSREGSRWLMHERLPRYGGEDERMSSEYLLLAAHLGLPTTPFRTALGIDAATAAAARARLARALGGAGPYAVLCPFTTRPQKHWPDDHWRALATLLTERHGLPLLVLGGPGDRAATERLMPHAGLVDLVGGTGLSEAAAIIRGARFLIGVDTGLTHIGTTFAVPTVALFGSTCPYLKTESRRTRVIYHALACAPCRRHPTCKGAFDCMRGITPVEVAATLDALLAAHAAEPVGVGG